MELKKSLGFIDIFSIACGAMISSGIFILPGLAFSQTGPGVCVAYFIAGIISLVGILSVIELATAMPKAGGDYYFINRTLGPMLGTISGLLSWFALSLKSSFAIFGLSEIIIYWLGLSDGAHAGMALFVVGSIATAGFVGLNIVGVKEAAKLEVVLSLALIALMVVFIIWGIPSVKVTQFEPFLLEGKNTLTLLSTAGFVFISFGGLLNVASISEELKNPRRNLPLGMVSSVVVITILYTLILVVTVGVMSAESLKDSLTPVADAARLFAGAPGFWAISIAAVLAFVTTANAGIMSAARYPLALSRDSLMPKVASRIHKRFDTPVVAVVATGVLIVLSLLMKLEVLVKAASTVILTTYLLASLSVIILRESKIQNYRPSFKTPLYPWLQIVTALIFIGLIVDMGLQAVEISVGLIVACGIVYFLYGRKINMEYALLHLLERITNKKLTERNLEEELKEIIHERDEIVKDDFDQIIENAMVLDEEGPFELDAFLDVVAEKIAEDRNVFDKDAVLEMLKAREDESSTALSPFVAIPHIIAEGEELFEIVLVRCRNGIKFSELNESVKAVFVILGTRDKRNLHLRSLAAIAQLIQNHDFEDKWEQAKSEENLRDILLLGERKRT